MIKLKLITLMVTAAMMPVHIAQAQTKRQAYVQRIAVQFGFHTMDVQECRLRKDEERWISGLVFLLQA